MSGWVEPEDETVPWWRTMLCVAVVAFAATAAVRSFIDTPPCPRRPASMSTERPIPAPHDD